jgi:hypothetical protein
LQILAEISFISGDLKGASGFLNRIKRSSPQHIPARLLQALLYLKKGSYRKSLDLLTATHSAAPQSFTLNFLLGVNHFLLSDFGTSAVVFEAAYHRRPLAQVSLLSSMAFYLGRSPGKAVSASRKARTRLNKSGFYHFLSGLISRQRKWSRKADIHFQQAFRQNEKWKNLLDQIDQLEPDQSMQKQTRLFISRLHREMEGLMTLFISEIQNFES